MRKFDNFTASLNVLHGADYEEAVNDEIYRMGVIGQFNLTFELGWKMLQEVLRLCGVAEAETGSPRDMIRLAYSRGLISDEEQWLLMLKKRNSNIHIYDEEEADEFLILIRDSFVPALDRVSADMRRRIAELEEG